MRPLGAAAAVLLVVLCHPSPAAACFRLEVPSPSRTEPPRRTFVRCAPPIARGDLDKAIVRRHLQARFPALRYCYERRLRQRPDLEGTAQLAFTVDPEGAVVALEVTGFAGDPIEACIADVIRSTEFPAQQNGDHLTQVHYPLTFVRLDAP